MLCPFHIQNKFFCSSIRNCIAYANEANKIVNKDSSVRRARIQAIMVVAFYKITYYYQDSLQVRLVERNWYYQKEVAAKRTTSWWLRQIRKIPEMADTTLSLSLFSTKFNNLMIIRFSNSGCLSYFTFKCSNRKMTGSFRLARCFGSTFVTMTVTIIEFKLLLFDVKREKRMFNSNIVLSFPEIYLRTLRMEGCLVPSIIRWDEISKTWNC